MSSWFWIAASAASIGSASAPAPPTTAQPANAALPIAATAQASAYDWDSYKERLAALARVQGVRASTVQANVPGLSMNSRVIELERTEPVAHSSGGVVGALEPYLRAHVTSSLITRGRANYRAHYDGLSRIYTRYGVDPSVP